MTVGRRIRVLLALAMLVALAIPSPAFGAVPGGYASPAASAPASAAASPGTRGVATALAAIADSSLVTLTGTLRVQVADSFAGGKSQTYYSLQDAGGLTPLTVTGSGADRLAGALVRVGGRRQVDGSVAVSAGAFAVVKTAAANPALGTLGTGTMSGVAKPGVAAQLGSTAVIIADYSDNPGYPVTAAQAADTFNTNAASVHSFFAAASRGSVNATATILGPWHLGIKECSTDGKTSAWNFDTSLNAARTQATAHSVDLSAYQHVILWTKQPCQTGWAGYGDVVGTRVQMVVDWATYPSDEPAVSAMVASHELGHNLGLAHANFLACFDNSDHQVTIGGNCRSDDYNDWYSTMGAAGPSDHALLDADRLRQLGWLASGESQTVVAVGTYTLVPVYSASAGVRLLRIARATPAITGGPSGALTLELRSTLAGSAWDQMSGSFASAATGVTVRFQEDASGLAFGKSYLLDATPNGTRTGGTTDLDSPVQPGQTLSDPIGGLTITVNSVDGSGASVTIGDTIAPSKPGSFDAAAIPTGGAELDWQASTDNLAVAYYEIDRDGTDIAHVPAPGLTYVDPPAGISGPHTYSVKAVDTAGLKSAALTASVTLTSPPTAPLAVTAIAGDGEALVAWSAPDQGAPITGYQVSSTTGDFHCTTTVALSCVVSGLTNGVAYQFTVIASNAVGPGPASAASNSVTPLADLPSRPTAVSGTPDDTTVAVTWTAPSLAGSSSIDGYTVTSSPGGKTCTTTGSIGCTVTQLTNGVAYTFTVKAHNDSGFGLPSDPSSPATPRTRPDAPVGVVGYGENLSALVTWGAPPFDGGSIVTAYDVISTPGSFTCHTSGARSCTIGGLTNRVNYTFKVQATNIAGTSDWSASSANSMPLYGATYFAVTPNRLLDTRTGTHIGLGASLTANASAVWFQVTGRSADKKLDVPLGAVAVTGNLTVVNAGSSGYLSLTPDRPAALPTTSSLNFPKSDTRANSVTVPLRADGGLWIEFVGGAGTKADALFDVTGYFVGNTSGATYKPLTPNRILDSRSPKHQGLGASLTVNVPARIQVTGQSSDVALNVPSNAVAVVGNLTAVNQDAAGYLSLTPDKPVGAPATSTINFRQRDTRANAVTVPLGSGGVLWVTYETVRGKHSDVLFDVTGYYVPGTSGASYVPLTPNRVIDTRSASHIGTVTTLVMGVPAKLQIAGRSADKALNVPLDAVAVTGNLTEVTGATPGYYALTPAAPNPLPTTSNLNFPRSDTRANAVTIQLGPGGTLWLTFVATTAARSDALFDVAGYFTMK
jgi:hypothetical protein